jgi:hypothetical protein
MGLKETKDENENLCFFWSSAGFSYMYQWEVEYLVFFISVCGATETLPVDYMRVTGLYLDCPDMEHTW